MNTDALDTLAKVLPGWSLTVDTATGVMSARPPGNTGVVFEGDAQHIIGIAQAHERLYELTRVLFGSADRAARALNCDAWPDTRSALVRRGAIQAQGKATAPIGAETRPQAQASPQVPKQVSAPPVYLSTPLTTPTESKGVLVGDECGVCGQPSIIRESSCRTRCKSCGAIAGGCG